MRDDVLSVAATSIWVFSHSRHGGEEVMILVLQALGRRFSGVSEGSLQRSVPAMEFAGVN